MFVDILENITHYPNEEETGKSLCLKCKKYDQRAEGIIIEGIWYCRTCWTYNFAFAQRCDSCLNIIGEDFNSLIPLEQVLFVLYRFPKKRAKLDKEFFACKSCFEEKFEPHILIRK